MSQMTLSPALQAAIILAVQPTNGTAIPSNKPNRSRASIPPNARLAPREIDLQTAMPTTMPRLDVRDPLATLLN